MRFASKAILFGLPYTLAVWVTAWAGLQEGDDALGLLAVLLGTAGIVVVAQVGWMQTRGSAWEVIRWNIVVLGVLGGASGALSAGEAAGGVVGGILLGIFTGFSAWWLTGGSLFRPTPTVFISYRRQDSVDAIRRLAGEVGCTSSGSAEGQAIGLCTPGSG